MKVATIIRAKDLNPRLHRIAINCSPKDAMGFKLAPEPKDRSDMVFIRIKDQLYTARWSFRRNEHVLVVNR